MTMTPFLNMCVEITVCVYSNWKIGIYLLALWEVNFREHSSLIIKLMKETCVPYFNVSNINIR